MSLIKKIDLTNYLITKYKEIHDNEKITERKLQKGLYFLYAFQGGKIRSQQLISNNDEIEEMTEMMFDYDEDLFDACFEAWSYGPVDREIHL